MARTDADELQAAQTEIADLKDAVAKAKRQQASIEVAADQRIQDALRSAEDCTSHGKEIHHLRHLAWSFKTRADRTHEGARGLIHLLHDISDGVGHGLNFDREKAPKTISRVLDQYVKRRDRVPFPTCQTCRHDQAPPWPPTNADDTHAFSRRPAQLWTAPTPAATPPEPDRTPPT